MKLERLYKNTVKIGIDHDLRGKKGITRILKEEKDKYERKLTWPLEYPEKVSKIVIHHTGTTKDLDNPEKAIRDIYYYHVMGRGWGDIGYNYIIDNDNR